MTAQDSSSDVLSLPREPLDLPLPLKELPEHAGEQEKTSTHSHHDSYNSHAVKTILSWHAPGRPFKQRGKEYFVNALLIMLLIQVVLFLFSQYLLMLVVASLVFVAFAFASVPPHDFFYKISTEGVMVEDHFFLWQELYDFYFKHKDGVDLLHIRTEAMVPGELVLVLGPIHMEQVKSALLPFLPFREYVRSSFMEKSGDWMNKTFPLERTASTQPSIKS